MNDREAVRSTKNSNARSTASAPSISYPDLADIGKYYLFEFLCFRILGFSWKMLDFCYFDYSFFVFFPFFIRSQIFLFYQFRTAVLDSTITPLTSALTGKKWLNPWTREHNLHLNSNGRNPPMSTKW